jgi:hypothetical protein
LVLLNRSPSLVAMLPETFNAPCTEPQPISRIPDESLHLRRAHLERFDGENERASDEISCKEGVHPGCVSPSICGLPPSAEALPEGHEVKHAFAFGPITKREHELKWISAFNS